LKPTHLFRKTVVVCMCPNWQSLFDTGVKILGHFARLPFHYCSRLPNVKMPHKLAAGKLKGLSKIYKFSNISSKSMCTNYIITIVRSALSLYRYIVFIPGLSQPCIPPRLITRIPASAGVKAGKSPLPGG